MSNNCLTQFLLALKSADIEKIKAVYARVTKEEQIEVLKFLFQSAQSNGALYGHYQDIASVCLQAARFPEAMIAAINSLEKFAFFSTPLIQTEQINNLNPQGNNVLHILLSQMSAKDNGLNYLRTLLHFESKELLQNALSQRNAKKLTPLECYLAFNSHTAPLSIQELSALLGLMEIERQHISTMENHNAKVIESHLIQQSRLSEYKQFLLATYYQGNAG
ncbi:hypothetical protein [Pseudoalteromonas piscicida]|uniref:Uncharacterized protein n=1 Tax=Pseudoalteromonas piscicida TaxID=43662 RepID=A0AAD0RGU2_PSEO7|nr:hypothetical protein [Pseudoalteromonas piscicida]ASD67912.1 hypothetical protein B1L02_13420 [Pseudoalteromonas piscicida]AXQ98844.1 hypothetical protein D0N37_14710 [Pseudoalteromonas piscicida]AXR01379.1 hypothetical protein D0511_04305 [Pseudoalteromonas piscicida]